MQHGIELEPERVGPTRLIELLVVAEPTCSPLVWLRSPNETARVTQPLSDHLVVGADCTTSSWVQTPGARRIIVR